VLGYSLSFKLPVIVMTGYEKVQECSLRCLELWLRVPETSLNALAQVLQETEVSAE
jgi:hypothetical protein